MVENWNSLSSRTILICHLRGKAEKPPASSFLILPECAKIARILQTVSVQAASVLSKVPANAKNVFEEF
jgi:hypothetical protein